MKSLHRGAIAGNAKLNGKKSKMLSCGCCTVENFKQECLIKEHNQEIYNALRGHNPDHRDHVYWDMTEEGHENYTYYLEWRNK